MTRTLEFIGGPRDGELIALPETRREYHIALRPGPLKLNLVETPSALVKPREGLYRVELCRPRGSLVQPFYALVWQGEA